MMEKRTRTPSVDMESMLIRAAETLLEQEGPDALSVRRIARFAGVAPMGLYNHFASKAGIVDALFCRGFERLEAAMASITTSDPLEAILEGGRRYRRLGLDHPASYQLMFLRAMPGFDPSAHARATAERAFGAFVVLVERAMDAEVLTRDNPSLSAQIIWSGLHGWVALEISEISFVDDREGGAEQLAEVMLRGLRP
jgi:AcrR family transcriptional regulator